LVSYIVAVAFKKFALNAFSFAHPEKNFRLLACASPIRFASLYAYDHYNRNISPACEFIASNGISPFSRKISYKGKLQHTTTSGSRLHEPSGRRRAWNSIIAPEVVCITAPNIAKAARRGDSDFYDGEMRWGGWRTRPMLIRSGRNQRSAAPTRPNSQRISFSSDSINLFSCINEAQ